MISQFVLISGLGLIKKNVVFFFFLNMS